MEPVLQAHVRFNSLVVSIRDVRCRAACSPAAAEELSTADTIVFPRTGLFVKHVGGDQVVGDSNQVLLFRRGEPYRVSHPIHGGDDCTVFQFTPEVLRDAESAFDPSARDRRGSAFVHGFGPADRRTFFTVQALRRELVQPPVDPLRIEETALDVLRATLANVHSAYGQCPLKSRPDTRRAHRELADATRVFLSASFHRPLSLDGIAAAVHSSPFHLSRLFRKDAGMPIHRYLTALRLRAALDRLADGAPDLTGLALELGFASHSHFTDSFRREFGAAPSAVRNGVAATRHGQMSKILEA
jgi:AraC-like DNA-binding protein